MMEPADRWRTGLVCDWAADLAFILAFAPPAFLALHPQLLETLAAAASQAVRTCCQSVKDASNPHLHWLAWWRCIVASQAQLTHLLCHPFAAHRCRLSFQVASCPMLPPACLTFLSRAAATHRQWWLPWRLVCWIKPCAPAAMHLLIRWVGLACNGGGYAMWLGQCQAAGYRAAPERSRLF